MSEMQQVDNLSTLQKGRCGEFRVISDLLKQNKEVYVPTNDQVNTDLVVFHKNSFKRIQIKTVGVYRNHSSVEVRMRSNKKNSHIDYVVIYLFHDDLIAYYPYNGEKCITLALKTAKNNQERVNWFYSYSELI